MLAIRIGDRDLEYLLGTQKSTDYHLMRVAVTFVFVNFSPCEYTLSNVNLYFITNDLFKCFLLF